MKYIFIFFISVYQYTLSPVIHSLLGVKNSCRYSVTCSEYAKQSIASKGIIKGSLLSLRRLLSCQPFGKIH